MLKIEGWQLQQMQGLSLEEKIIKSKMRIREWYDHWLGEVYVSFSGGKDSTVLLDLVRQNYPHVEAVFVDTGLEYPEIREFVKSIDNVTWIKPKMGFKEVIEKYGYPVVSKEVSRDVCAAKNTPDGKTYLKFVRGSDYHKKYGDQYLLEKWKYLIDSDFKISYRCCDVMKKTPFKKYQKESGKNPITGTMAQESRLRKKTYLHQGCNGFNSKNPISMPLGFWTEQDILLYLKKYNLPYAKCYGEIIEENGKLKTTKCDRTGCIFCMFGCHLDKPPNRFQRLKNTHPKQYDYCMKSVEEGGLGLAEVLDYIGVDYK